MEYRLVNGFIDHLYTPLRTTSNYSAIASLHILEITTVAAKLYQAFCLLNNRSLGTALTV
jgi:hypothetical protein